MQTKAGSLTFQQKCQLETYLYYTFNYFTINIVMGESPQTPFNFKFIVNI